MKQWVNQPAKWFVIMMACMSCLDPAGAQADSEPQQNIPSVPVFNVAGFSARPSDETKLKLDYFLSINGFSSVKRPGFLGAPTVSEPPGRYSWYLGSFRSSAPFYLRITQTERPPFTDYDGEVIWPPDTKAGDRSGISLAELSEEVRKLDNSTLEGYGKSIIPLHVSLPESRAILLAPSDWRLEPYWNFSGIAPAEKTKGSLSRKIHLQTVKGSPRSLQEAIDAELDRITEQSGPRGSYNDRRAYKGSVPVQTASGLEGLHAAFWSEIPEGRRYLVEKYYFYDANHHAFKVCAHIYGGQAEYERFEKAILQGLYLQPAPSASRAEPSRESPRQ